eukprot:552367_1
MADLTYSPLNSDIYGISPAIYQSIKSLISYNPPVIARNILQNNYFELKNVKNTKRNSSDHYDDLSILSYTPIILNDYTHVLTSHLTTDEQFEIISRSLGFCDIKTCGIFRRNYCDRTELVHNHNWNMLYENGGYRVQILDKIHCFFQHCYDINNKISSMSSTEKNKMHSTIRKLQKSSAKNMGVDATNAQCDGTISTCSMLSRLAVYMREFNELSINIYEYDDTYDKYYNVDDIATIYDENIHMTDTDVSDDEDEPDISIELDSVNVEPSISYQIKQLQQIVSSKQILYNLISHDWHQQTGMHLDRHKYKRYSSQHSDTGGGNGSGGPKPKPVQTFDMYQLGTAFKYGDSDKTQTPGQTMRVDKKYVNLKQEIIHNNLSVLSINQYESEMAKAEVHLDSKYRKQCYPSMNVEHMLSLMLYCNYSVLQNKFTQTFWNNVKHHTEFFHLGSLLKQSVHEFGTKMRKGIVKSLYHGIDKIVMFPQLLGNDGYGICIQNPTSSSSSIVVGAQYAQNTGIVVEFCGWNVKHFSVAWLSDYGNESEYLFVQMCDPIEVTDIAITHGTYGKSCEQYHSILDALKVIDCFFFMISMKWHVKCDTKLIIKIIHHKLSKSYGKYKSFYSLTEYGKQMIDVYCNNKKKIYLDFSFMKTDYSFLYQELCYSNYEWIKIELLVGLFPNVENICISNLHVSDLVLNDILYSLQFGKNTDSTLEKIEIDVTESNDTSNIKIQVSSYLQRYDNIQWKMSIDNADLARNFKS